jgi:glycosyltransferase involved in cell wall biosynthesis
VNDIVDKVSRLLLDKSLRQRMGHTAAQHVEGRFGYEQFKARLLRHLFKTSSNSVFEPKER